MSSRFRLLSVFVLFLGCTPAFALAKDDGAGRLATYQDDSSTAFAMSVDLNCETGPALPRDVIVLVDTSVQPDRLVPRRFAKVLKEFLGHLNSNDRVRVFAVDLDLVPLNDSFVSAGDEAMTQACAKLASRAPLGSTDMAKMLTDAPELFDWQKSAERSLVYIGDGISRGGMVSNSKFKVLVDKLAEDQISVSSFAIGPERNIEFLAALANHTGGNIFVDTDKAGSVDQAALGLANTVHGSVFWPSDVQISSSVREIFPVKFPPIRTDRDTVVVGTLSNTSDVSLQITGYINGKSVETQWSMTPEASNPDFAFLAKMLDDVRANQGMPMAAIGSGGLREMARVIEESSQVLTALSAQALANGDANGASQLLDAALKNDPANSQAEALQDSIGHGPSMPQDETAPPAKAAAPASKSPAAPVQQTPQASAPAQADDTLVLGSQTQEPTQSGGVEQQENKADADFMQTQGEQISAAIGHIKAEVRNTLEKAAEEAKTGPDHAVSRLKDMLDVVERDPILDASTRNILRSQLQSALISAQRQKFEVEEQLAQQRRSEATRAETDRIYRDMVRREEQIAGLINRFNSLLAERNFVAASEIPQQILDMDRKSIVANSIEERGPIQYNHERMWALRRERQVGVLDTLMEVERSYVPFSANPPLVFPDPEEWATKVAARRQYLTIRWSFNPRDEAILSKLNDIIGEWDFDEEPLSEVINKIFEDHGITVVLDPESTLTAETPVTFKVTGIRLKSALKLLLDQHDATYVVKDEVMKIISKDQAADQLVTYVYNVGDLVAPRTPLPGALGQSGGGGFGGGGGGGVGGGGFGGGGGGGIGGGGFGGGGGAFSVQDEIQLGTKKSAVETRPTSVRKDEPTQPQAISVTPNGNQTSRDAWREYMASHQADPADVRETVRELMKRGDTTQVADVIYGAMASGQSQSWMYEALVLALQISGAPQADVERAVMSAVDYSDSTSDALMAAKYMADNAMQTRAIALLKDIAESDPLRPEPYVIALNAAQRIKDTDGIEWATLGVLSQAWPNHVDVVAEALKAAKTLEIDYRREGKTAKLESFLKRRDEALYRDCVIEVAWTGNADIDLYVEEPGGSVCSRQVPRTTGGGILMGDAASNEKSDQQTVEHYVLPKGFSGTYRLYLHRVWGEVPSGKATVTILRNFRSPEQSGQTKQVSLSSEGAIVVFDLDKGRRTESLDAQKLASLIETQEEVNEGVIASDLNRDQSSRAAQSYYGSRPDAPQGDQEPIVVSRDGRRFGPKGYQPVITTLPQGTSMSARAVTADRLHVIISPTPTFSAISKVDTFTFNGGFTGGGGGAGGAGGGIGGAGGGAGGGIGGAGGGLF